jgi:hypothetical protein
MCQPTRRSVIASMAAGLSICSTRVFGAAPDEHHPFITVAFQMKEEAVRAGD